MPKNLAVLILAAGKGKRMRSVLPKVLHSLYGKPIVHYALERGMPLGKTCVVVGHGADEVRKILPKGVASVLQKNQRGTGDAVLSARGYFKNFKNALILSGDAPLLTDETLARVLDVHRSSGAAATLVSAKFENPTGYGRILRNAGGTLARIVEEADATDAERAVREANTGTYCFAVAALLRCLPRLTTKNAQGEYYLTDVLSMLLADGEMVNVVQAPHWTEALGVNSQMDLALAHEVLRRRKLAALMEEGVSFLDPSSAHVSPDVEIGADTVVEPNVLILGASRIGKNCRVGLGCRVEGSTVGDGVTLKAYSLLENAVVEQMAVVGPFARLRPGTVVGKGAHIGNFVETKKAIFGEGSKANHLSYVGDAKVGKGVNVGAGTITCNYDGVNKHETVMEDGVFIGSGSQLVAPVRIGKGAYIGAGSTITKDVPADALALTRAEQRVVAGWAKRRRAQRKPKKRARR